MGRKRKNNNADFFMFTAFVSVILAYFITEYVKKFEFETVIIATIIAIALTLTGVLLWIRYKKNRTSEDSSHPDVPYSSPKHITKRFRRRLFMTKAELEFYYSLKKAIPHSVTIHSHVGLWAIVDNIHHKDWNKISQKHIDFILYEEIENLVLLAIELDDSSHNSYSAQKRDAAKNEILQDAGIPLLRIWVTQYYDTKTLVDKIIEAIKNNNTRTRR